MKNVKSKEEIFLYPTRRHIAPLFVYLGREEMEDEGVAEDWRGERSGQAIFTTENPLFFPIRSADPIFRRSHFRLAVFLPTRV